MKSVMSNVLMKQSQRHRSINFLSAQKDFPLDIPVPMRILRGSPSRTLWKKGAVVCSSTDGLTGQIRNSETRTQCADCKYLNGVDERGTFVKCKLQCDLFATKVGDPKEYKFSIPRNAQINLTFYVDSLIQRELDIPDVITNVTRVNTPEGYTSYVFSVQEEIKEEDIPEELFDSTELQSAMTLFDSFKLTGDTDITAEEFAKTLLLFDNLKGLTMKRAISLAKHIGVGKK